MAPLTPVWKLSRYGGPTGEDHEYPDGVDGSRPYCSADGVGAVLAVFWSGPGYAGRITRVVSLNQTGRTLLAAAKHHKLGVSASAKKLATAHP